VKKRNNSRYASHAILSRVGAYGTKELTMINKNLFPRLLFASLCTFSIPALCADEPSVNLDRPGAGMVEIKEGDKVPDEYKREALALKDWQKRHLTAPDENSQWVEIQDKYVLVNIPNGTVKTLILKSSVQK